MASVDDKLALSTTVLYSLMILYHPQSIANLTHNNMDVTDKTTNLTQISIL